jgi:hypothetical protein
MAAAAAGHGSLAPHRRPVIPIRRVGSMDDDPSSNQLCFSTAREGLWPSKRSDGKAIMAINLPCHRSVLRAIDPLVARENYIRLLGGSCPINPMHPIRMIGILCGAREPSCPAVAAMVMGGVVGRWLCLRCTNPTVGIHKKSLRTIYVSFKNILFWSKFYSGSLDVRPQTRNLPFREMAYQFRKIVVHTQ